MSPIPSSASAPLSPAESPVLPPPQIVAIDTAAPSGQDGAEKAREAAYDAVYEWQGIQLLPFSESRERLWMRLCAGDVPLPDVIDAANLDPYISHAVKLLYLCSHQPEEFRHLRPDTGLFLETIDAWGEKHVPREKSLAAVTLALRITNDARRSLAIPRPTDARDSGN